MSQPGQQHAAALGRQLRGLERRRRVLSAARAVGLWVCLVLPAAGLLCLVDWYSGIPLPVRWVATAGLIALGVALARRVVLPALATRRAVDDVALSVEARFPQLADRVISTVQLDRRRGDPGYGSEELKEATAAQAAEFAGRVRMAQAQPLSRFLPMTGVALAVLLAAGWAVASFPNIVGIWAVRCVWRMDYPHKTRIDQFPRRLLVARGEPAVISVQAGGLLPGRGAVRVRSGSSGWVEQELTPRGRRGQYVATIPQVVEKLPFRIRLGDAPEESGEVDVTDRPEVAAISATLRYPDYVKLPEELVRTGHLRALPGTHVRLAVESSKPLASARLAFDNGRRIELALAGSATASGEFDIEADIGYAVELADTQGFANASPVRYRITAAADLAPRVQLVRPGAETMATPVSIIKMEYKISDDYGLRRGRLMFRANEEKQFRAIPLPLPGVSASQPEGDLPQPGPRRADQSFLWDLSPLGLKIGDVITYRLAADDHARREPPAPGVSPDREIRIVDEETVRKQLREQLEATAQEIERVFHLERESAERVQAIMKEMGQAGPTTKKE